VSSTIPLSWPGPVVAVPVAEKAWDAGQVTCSNWWRLIGFFTRGSHPEEIRAATSLWGASVALGETGRLGRIPSSYGGATLIRDDGCRGCRFSSGTHGSCFEQLAAPPELGGKELRGREFSAVPAQRRPPRCLGPGGGNCRRPGWIARAASNGAGAGAPVWSEQGE